MQCAGTCHVVPRCTTLYYVRPIGIHFVHSFARRISLDENFNQSEARMNMTEHSMNETERRVSVPQQGRAQPNVAGGLT